MNPIPSKEKITREISAGFIVYRQTQEGPKFLVLYHGHNYWNFPKGKIESEEGSLDAALRETQEETGLGKKDIRIIQPFKAYERFTFRSRRGNGKVFKVVIFYLAETRNPHIKLSDEHEGYGWFTFREGAKLLGRYRDSQRVLDEANRFLKRGNASHHQRAHAKKETYPAASHKNAQ